MNEKDSIPCTDATVPIIRLILKPKTVLLLQASKMLLFC